MLRPSSDSTSSSLLARFSSVLVARRKSWLTLAVMVLLAVVVMGVGKGPDTPSTGAEPTDSESAKVARIVEQHTTTSSVLMVFSRDSGALTSDDVAAARAAAAAVATELGESSPRLSVSEDGAAAVASVQLEAGASNSATATTVKAMRATLDAQPLDGLTAQVTGGAAFGADIASAFDGANITLLLVTVGIVGLLLLLTYRSPVLWLVPLAVVGIADQAAAIITSRLGHAFSWQFDGGIVSVLVFGAGANYALLMISRYREELRRTPDHRVALADAVRATVPAILASNVTVVLSLLTLVLAVIPGTHGLGLASAIGLLIALVFVVVALPPALAVCGPRLFWPFVPRPGAPVKAGAWERVARRVSARPGTVVTAAVLLLVLMASGLFGVKVGLSQADQFRVQSESAAGLTTLGKHFPAGEAQPLTVVARTDQAPAVVAELEQVSGVVRVQQGDAVGRDSLITVVGTPAPATPASLQLVRDVRTAAHDVPGAHALVGGPVAQELDVRDGNTRDLLVVAPLILVISLLVFVVLLRSLLAPVLLMLTNLLSAVATIGAGAWISEHVFGFPALDDQVPLIAFLFLVALGVDYTIFLVHRIKLEAGQHGTSTGVVRAVAATGGVITSAGMVLAGVFAALGILPLVTLAQLGLIVGLGVLVDTFLVRTLLVTGLFALLREKMWWPARPSVHP